MVRGWIVLGLIVLGVAPCAAFELDEWDPAVGAAIGVHYSVGDYDLSRDTEVLYVPLLLRAQFGHWSAELTLPYIRIHGPIGIVGTFGGQEGAPQPPPDTETDEVESADGFGDIALESRYWIEPFFRWMPYLTAVGQVKFPSASERDGLGTGAYDFGVALEAAWLVGKTSLLLSGGRRFLGDGKFLSETDGEVGLETFPLDDVFTAYGGALYAILDAWDAGLLLSFQQATSDNSDPAFDVIPYTSWRFAPHWSADVYTSFGVTDGSPDYGVGLQISHQIWPR